MPAQVLTSQGAWRAANVHMHKQSDGEHDIKMEGSSNGCYVDAQALLQPTPTALSSKDGTAMGFLFGWISSIVACLNNLFGWRVCEKSNTGSCSSITVKILSESDVADSEADSSLSFKSSTSTDQIRSLTQQTGEFASRDVESEIRNSRIHWTETSEPAGASEANKEIFRSLKKRWGGFFVDRGHLWELKEKIAEGGQAEIYNAARSCREGYVLKVFKSGNALEYLQHQIPRGMLHSSDYSGFGFEHYAIKNVLGGTLLKDGRFAFEMWGDWGDLRTLIDARMKQNRCPPFTDEEVGNILLDIARGMKELHRNKIVHRDLKASNVLVVHYKNYRGTTFVPAGDNFHCAVADYECSLGVKGTGYWRAPEILRGLKDGNVKEHLFTKKADVYSYGMTCYEVLTGNFPLEGTPRTAYDVVIANGARPHLPNHIQPIFRTLLTRCWLSNPSERPSFEDIVDDFQKFGIGKWDTK